MSIRQLQYFVALYDECHFGRAAERCNVTQSTFSMQLAKLERYLGAELFTRNSRNVQPTALAQQVIAIAREVVGGCEEISRVAERAEAG
jgi:LysR family hydrogen peroxide-inducible transcriptional activator